MPKRPGKNKYPVSDRIGELTNRKKIPLNILFELTYNCNLKCVHCYVVKDRKRKELSLNEVKNILTQLAEAGCLTLIFTGGEILTRHDFFAIADYARKKNFCLTLFTNGTLIDEQAADKIAKIYPLRVEISVYGVNDSTHDAVTRVPGSFEQSTKSLKLLKKRGVRTKIKCTLMRQNIGEYKGIISLAEELGAEYSFDPNITPKSNGSEDPLCLQISDDDLHSVLADPMLNVGVMEANHTKKSIKTKQDRVMCRAGKNFCDISAYGDVMPCVQFLMKAGSLREKSFQDIWRDSEVFQRIRSVALVDLPGCRECSLLRFCSRCPGLALLENGDFLAPSPVACNTARIKNQLYSEH